MTRTASHYDKQDASTRFAAALRALGWTTHNYKENESDSMTDYYSPSYWMYGAVATHPDFPDVRIGCNTSEGDVAKSGQPVTRWRKVRDASCPRCKGSLIDPDLGCWTLTAARQDVAEYVRQNDRIAHNGAVSIFPMVDDRDFTVTENGNSFRHCFKCQGKGTKAEGEDVVDHYEPVIKHPTPKGFMYHIEKGEKRITQFKGWVQMCDRDTGKAAAELAAKHVTDIARQLTTGHKAKPTSAPKPTDKKQERGVSATATVGDVLITISGTWTWVKFPGRPSEKVLAGLRGLDGRYAPRREAWYFTRVVDVDTLTPIINEQ